jgi:hypothetical protein
MTNFPNGIEGNILGTGNFEPQRVYNFSLAINGLNDTKLALESMTLPTKMVSEIELNFLNTRRYVAGRASYEALPIVIKDVIQGSTANEINNWHQTVFDPGTGHIGLASRYKRNGEIILFGPDGSAERTWILEGCWPTVVNFGSLDYNSDDVVRLEMQLRFDRCFAGFSTFGSLPNFPAFGF